MDIRWGLVDGKAANSLVRAHYLNETKATPLLKATSVFKEAHPNTDVPNSFLQLFCAICHGYATKPCELCTMSKLLSNDADRALECSKCKVLHHSLSGKMVAQISSWSLSYL